MLSLRKEFGNGEKKLWRCWIPKISRVFAGEEGVELEELSGWQGVSGVARQEGACISK